MPRISTGEEALPSQAPPQQQQHMTSLLMMDRCAQCNVTGVPLLAPDEPVGQQGTPVSPAAMNKPRYCNSCMIGKKVRVFWPVDENWYEGIVHEYDPSSGEHLLRYEDGDSEWVRIGSGASGTEGQHQPPNAISPGDSTVASKGSSQQQPPKGDEPPPHPQQPPQHGGGYPPLDEGPMMRPGVPPQQQQPPPPQAGVYYGPPPSYHHPQGTPIMYYHPTAHSIATPYPHAGAAGASPHEHAILSQGGGPPHELSSPPPIDPRESMVSPTGGAGRSGKKGPKAWSKHEDATLLKIVQSMSMPMRWSVVAQSLPDRTGKQCRERYVNHLNPRLKTTDWSPTEDATIFHLYATIGSHWSTMSKVIPGRTDNGIKNRFHNLRRQLEREDGHRLRLSNENDFPDQIRLERLRKFPTSLQGKADELWEIQGGIGVLSAQSVLGTPTTGSNSAAKTYFGPFYSPTVEAELCARCGLAVPSVQTGRELCKKTGWCVACTRIPPHLSGNLLRECLNLRRCTEDTDQRETIESWGNVPAKVAPSKRRNDNETKEEE